MPKLTIDHSTNLPSTEAVQKIKTFFENDQDIRRLDPNIQCQVNGLNASVKGSKFKAEIAVKSQGTGSQIQVVVDLPLLLAPFKGKVQETIQKKLSKYMA